MNNRRSLGKTYLVLIIVSILFITGCSSDLPPWSMHGEETVDDTHLNCRYLIRYQSNDLANNVIVKIEARTNDKIIGIKVSQIYKYVYSGEVINPKFKLPLNNGIDDPTNVKVKIYVDWSDKSGTHSTDLTSV